MLKCNHTHCPRALAAKYSWRSSSRCWRRSASFKVTISSTAQQPPVSSHNCFSARHCTDSLLQLRKIERTESRLDHEHFDRCTCYEAKRHELPKNRRQRNCRLRLHVVSVDLRANPWAWKDSVQMIPSQIEGLHASYHSQSL